MKEVFIQIEEVIKLYFRGYSVEESLDMVINKSGDKMLNNFDFKLNDKVKFKVIEKRIKDNYIAGRIVSISKNKRWASVEIAKTKRIEGIFFEDIMLVERNI